MTAGSIPEDFLDMLECLDEAAVEFVIVGAYALARHGYTRATRDIDILVLPSPENAKRVMAALHEFGAPIAQHGVVASDFETAGNVYQIGVPPVRIDLLTQIAGVDAREAIDSSVEGTIGERTVRFLSIPTLIENKRATGRPKDQLDAEQLLALHPQTRE